MTATGRCPACGASVAPGMSPCPHCGSAFAGARQVAVEPMRQEAMLVFSLLESAGLHPILAFHDDSGTPHQIEPEEPFTRSVGLMIPVTTTFAVYVPESEAGDAQRVLEDAGRAAREAGES
jgi:hypothetical protein